MLFKIKFVKVYDKHNFSLIKTILIKKKTFNKFKGIFGSDIERKFSFSY